MKRTAPTLTVVVLGLFLAGSTRSSAQVRERGTVASSPRSEVGGDDLLQRRARLSVKEATVREALEELHRRSGIPIAFSPSLLPIDRRVSCDCRDATLREALSEILPSGQFRFIQISGQVLIETRPVVLPDPPRRVVALASFAIGSPAPLRRLESGSLGGSELQEMVLSGVVIDDKTLSPIVGAQVVVEGTGQGALTNAAGAFRILGLSGREVTLRVVMIGYRPYTEVVQVGAQDLRVRLTASAVELNEIIVTGTAGGTQRRAVGNAVSRVDAAEIVSVAPVTDVGQLITGRAPGAVVQIGSGVVGSGPRIRIRGQSSLTLNDQPLLYVDGVRVENSVGAGPQNQGSNRGVVSRLNDFAPEDIESIEIIKGPAAATLYGTEASNGVIQIITKRGREGAPTWKLSVRQGTSWFADPAGRIAPAWGRDGSGAVFSINPYDLELDAGRKPLKNGYNQGYNLSVSGGSDLIRYYVGGTADREEGIELGDGLQSYSGRVNLSFNTSEKFSANTSMAYVNTHREFPAEGVFGGAIWALQSFTPALLDTPREGWVFGYPLAWEQAYEFSSSMDRFTGSLGLDHKPTGWFTHRLHVGVDRLHEDNFDLRRAMNEELTFLFGASNGAGLKRLVQSDIANFTVDYGATASWAYSPSVSTETSFGFQYYDKVTKLFDARGRRFAAPSLTSISATALTEVLNDAKLENATVGVYFQERVGYRDRLFATVAIRMDDNSAFGSDFDVATYPKGSLTWVVSEEPFWGWDVVNTLRFRAAYGQSGQQPGAFDAVRTYLPQTGADGQPVLSALSIGNSGLGPEKGTELEVGFDAGLWQDRAGLELTAYRQRTLDAIAIKGLPPSGGFGGGQFVNVGEIRNQGMEALLKVRALDRSRAKLDLDLNLAYNDNQVVDVGDAGGGQNYIALAGGSGGVTTSSGQQRHQEGYPVASWFGRRVVSAQVDAQANVVNALCDDGDGGTVDCGSAPSVYLGRPVPSTTGSIMSTLTLFDRLRIHALLDFQRGHMIRDDNLADQCDSDACEQFYHPERFAPEEVAAARLHLSPAFGLQKGDFMKLREVAVSYEMPSRLAAAINASRAQLTVSARNLATWTSYTGLDPELFLPAKQFSASEIGVTPPLTQFQVKLDISF